MAMDRQNPMHMEEVPIFIKLIRFPFRMDPVSLTAFFEIRISSRFNVAWDLGDGTLSNLHEFKHRYKALGNYTVQLFVHDLCRNTFDTLDKRFL